MKAPPVVYVTWRDCTSCDAWMMPPDVEDIGCPLIETCGFLAFENDDALGVSVAWEPHFGKVAGTFTIPWSQIETYERLYFPARPAN